MTHVTEIEKILEKSLKQIDPEIQRVPGMNSTPIEIDYQTPDDPPPLDLLTRTTGRYPESVVVRIDPSSPKARVTTDLDVHLNSTGEAVYHSRESVFTLKGTLREDSVQVVLYSPEAQYLLEAIHDGFDTTINNGNVVGVWTDRACVAKQHLEELIRKYAESIDPDETFDPAEEGNLIDAFYDDPSKALETARIYGLKSAAEDLLFRIEEWMEKEHRVWWYDSEITTDDLMDAFDGIPSWLDDLGLISSEAEYEAICA